MGLAMRAGRAMLLMPCAWDQPDNAERAARLGIARVIPRRRYTAARVAAELRLLLDDPAYARRALEVGREVAQEDGVRVACDALAGILQGQIRGREGRES
jgi:UDP:flavonoid glycosyltransferase YjiC (YdhE family)